MKKNEILAALNFRHACKEFNPNKKIPTEDFKLILEAARLSPSSFGFEPWHFVVVQDKILREKFKEHIWGGQTQLPTASHIVFTLTKKSYFMKFDSDYILNFMKDIQELPEDVVSMKKDFYERFQNHDFELLKSKEALDSWSAHQTYIPLANMMTVAAFMGIDSCPMEGFNLKEVDSLLSSELGINLDKYSIAYVAAFGFRIQEPRSKTRQSMGAITTWA